MAKVFWSVEFLVFRRQKSLSLAQELSANKRHFFTAAELQGTGPFSHVRLNMFPDGGISRLRVYGNLARD